MGGDDHVTVDETTMAACFEFRIQEAFPPSDSLSVPLLQLAGVTNDVMLLQRQIAQAQQRQREGNRLEGAVLYCEIGYWFRALCGHLFEAGAVLRTLDRGAVHAALEKVGDTEAWAAFERLEALYREDDSDSLCGKVLTTIRNEGIFHYDPRAFNRAVNDGTRRGQMILADLLGFNRYAVADLIVDEVTIKAVGDAPGALERRIEEAVEAAICFGVLTAGLLRSRLEPLRHRDQLVMQEEGTIRLPGPLLRARAEVKAERERQASSERETRT